MWWSWILGCTEAPECAGPVEADRAVVLAREATKTWSVSVASGGGATWVGWVSNGAFVARLGCGGAVERLQPLRAPSDRLDTDIALAVGDPTVVAAVRTTSGIALHTLDQDGAQDSSGLLLEEASGARHRLAAGAGGFALGYTSYVDYSQLPQVALLDAQGALYETVQLPATPELSTRPDPAVAFEGDDLWAAYLLGTQATLASGDEIVAWWSGVLPPELAIRDGEPLVAWALDDVFLANERLGVVEHPQAYGVADAVRLASNGSFVAWRRDVGGGAELLVAPVRDDLSLGPQTAVYSGPETDLPFDLAPHPDGGVWVVWATETTVEGMRVER